MPQPTLIGAPGVEAAWRLAHHALLLGGGNGRSDRNRNRLGDLVLHCKDVGEIAIVAFGPNMLAGLGLDRAAAKSESNSRAMAGAAA